MADTKNKELRLRRTLKKHGYALHKSRRKNWSYDNQCGYMIVDAGMNCVVGGCRFDYSLEDVEDWVSSVC